ncbi:competence protein CoiA [Virgibacillus kekensis]|uniref:Competence protein CoiA n=1 Tax=Virgibacillus kekensis TaxID=202261 RepID=A0ABV9DKI8_9BACI
MLQATTEYGELVTLAMLTRPEIFGMRQENFFCPTCHSPVIVKAGPQIIPHFAHLSIDDCPSREGGEGIYHEKGKLLLYQWLLGQGLNAQLEAYLPDIQQRPDILLTIGERRIAIEYQCARIPAEQIHSRTLGYHSIGIKPIWILGANRFERQSRHHLKIDQFQRQFIHQSASTIPQTIYYFCPDTLQFIFFQDIYFSANHRAAGKFHITKLNNMMFTDLFRKDSFTENELFLIWIKEKRSFRTRPPGKGFGLEHKWRQWLYQKGTYKDYLPTIIDMPVSAGYLMKTPPWDWQSRLCLDIIDPLPIGSRLSLKMCERQLRRYLYSHKDFPLITIFKNPIEQYLTLLTRTGILNRESTNTFSKRNALLFYRTMDEALAGDVHILNLLTTGKMEA